MRPPLFPALAALVALAALALPGATLAQTGPGACVGSACPGGHLACVTNGVDPRLDFCVVQPECSQVVWFDERVGPYHVWASGCAIHVQYEGDELHLLP